MKFQSFDNVNHTTNQSKNNIELLRDVNMKLNVRIGDSSLSIEEIMNIQIGSVIPLNKSETDLFDVVVNGVKIAEGLLVVVGNELAVKIQKISPKGG